MTLKARIYLTLALLFATFSLSAQIYPVQLNVRLIPPYSVYLADYATNGQLQVLVLQRDLTEPSYSLRLSMEVQLGGNVILRTSQQYAPPPIIVAPGQPVLLNAEDLLPYLDPNNLDFFGYSRSRYEQTKALPEGAYTIRFTAYDYHRNEVAVSAPAQNFYYLAKAEPPMLSLPYSGQQLPAEHGRPILFQWLPRNTGSLNSAMSTAYRLELFEIRPEGQNPQAVAQSARPIFSIETEQNQYIYTPTDPELEPNLAYAWRVQAFDRDGRDAFVNRGYSEVFHFLYGTPADGSAALEPIPDLKVVAISPYAAKAEWSSTGYDSFVLSYRKSGGDNEWFTTTTKDTSLTVAQLEENTSYEFRVQGLLEGREGPLSDLVGLNTPARVPHVCGEPTAKPQQELGEPLADLSVGSLVRVGDFVLKVSEASGGGGTFTGKGQVYIPFLEGLSVAVTFKNVYINTALELTTGQVIAESMPLDQWIADKLQKQGIVQKQQPVGDVDVNFPINSPKDIKVLTPDGKPYTPSDSADSDEPIPAKIVVKDAKGVEHIYDVPNLPATITDSKGNTYQVDREGKVSQLAKGGEPIAREDLANLNLTNARVDFSGASSYAFATLHEDYTGDFRDAFEVLADHGGSGSYAVPFQLLEAGKSVEVQAMLTLNNQKLDTAKLSFVTGANQRLVPKSIMHDGNGRYTYTLVLPAMSARDGLEIFAVMTPAEGQHYSIGKLTALAYERKQHKVVLIPVGKAKGKIDQLTEAVSKGLKEAYNPLAIDFNVTQDSGFDVADSQWDTNGDGMLQVSGSGAFATLTEEMKALNAAYRQAPGYDPQTAYLFVLERADSANVAGDMPRGKQFGYLFLNGIKSGDAGRLAAHELGHGLFTLRHSWNYCKSPDQLSENLMSYGSGTALTKYQWDMVHNPETAWDMWKSDEEGMRQDCNAPKPTVKGKEEGQKSITSGWITYATTGNRDIIDCKRIWHYHLGDRIYGSTAGWYERSDYLKLTFVQKIMEDVGLICGDIKHLNGYVTEESINGAESRLNYLSKERTLSDSLFYYILSGREYANLCKDLSFYYSGSGKIEPVYIEFDIIFTLSGLNLASVLKEGSIALFSGIRALGRNTMAKFAKLGYQCRLVGADLVLYSELNREIARFGSKGLVLTKYITEAPAATYRFVDDFYISYSTSTAAKNGLVKLWKAPNGEMVWQIADDIATKGAKFTSKQIDEYVVFATKNSNAKKVIFGKWDKGASTSYVSRASDDYTYFSLGDKWDEIFGFVGKNNDEMWKINKLFIDNQKSLGKEFYFSHDPKLADGFFLREVNYIKIDLKAKDIIKVNDNLWKVIW